MSEGITLCLYIAGKLPNSARALANLKLACEESLHGPCKIEIVDVFEEPLRALENKVLVTPTLIVGPEPALRIVGDLSDRSRLVEALRQRGPSNGSTRSE